MGPNPWSASTFYLLHADELTSNANNDQWLSSKDRKHDGAENRREQDLINAEALVRLLKHIQRESQGGKNTVAIVSLLVEYFECYRHFDRGTKDHESGKSKY